LALVFMMTGAFCGMAQKATAQGVRLSFTVHVRNYAGVDPKTLANAEKLATGIFRDSRVETHWVTTVGPSREKLEETIAPNADGLSNLQLNVLSREMSDRLGLPDKVMGITPGKGADRRQIYVLYSNVEVFSQSAHAGLYAEKQYIGVTESVILGSVIAHELGHALLNMDSHTDAGIMRGTWDINDLLEAERGRLVFTREQAEVIRAEVARRMNQ
jgi:hypothetical protein